MVHQDIFQEEETVIKEIKFGEIHNGNTTLMLVSLVYK